MTFEREKLDLRRRLRAELQQTSEGWLALANHNLIKRIKEVLTKAKVSSLGPILGWLPHFYAEPDLRGFYSGPGLKIFCPLCNEQDHLEFFTLDYKSLRKGAYGILEPDRSISIPLNFNTYKNIVCLIPGLAFDRAGRRLGRGLAYYDKFLSSIPSDVQVLKIGLCWSFQLIDSVPAEVHDQPVDIICTEQEIVGLIAQTTDYLKSKSEKLSE